MTKKTDKTAPPKCDRVNCFACLGRQCRILVDNDFGGRDCPFYKTKDRLEAERARCVLRLRQIGMIIR